MKTILNLLVLLLASSTLYSTPLSGSQPKALASVSWETVEAYIEVHATRADPLAVAMLEAEVSEGQSTWVLFQGMSGGGLAVGTPLDGGGIGWPAAGCVVLFPTTLQATTAAELVLAATMGAPGIDGGRASSR